MGLSTPLPEGVFVSLGTALTKKKMGFTRETVLGSAAVLSILPSSLRSFWKMAGSVCRPASSFISVFRIVQFFSHLKAAMKLFR